MPITVINTETMAISEYSLEFLDVISIDGTVYGITEDGIYKLEGQLEDGPIPYIETGAIDLANGARCNAKKVWLTVATENGLKLTTTAYSNGEDIVSEYNIVGFPGSQLRERTERLGRGTDGDLWKFRIEAPVGGGWQQSEMSVDIDRVRHPR